MSTGKTLIRTKDLSVGFKIVSAEKRLFENLNLQLRAGEFVCFMGPNGVGKSSLIRTIAGLQVPLGGIVDRGGPPEDLSRQMSVVLTERIQSHNLTVRDLITFGRYPYLSWNASLSETDEKMIGQALELLGLQALESRLIHELSDGQLQMVMIARAIAQDTPVILLDEPTAHLDLNNRVEIMKLLRRLTRELHKSILVSTHELDLALQTADVTWLAGDTGSIITGMPEDLVLNGSFDMIFRLKGFDLKTGRVVHQKHSEQRKVFVEGSGPEYLWTRNALERCDYRFADKDENSIHIYVIVEEGKPRWSVTLNNRPYRVNTIADLIELIGSNDCEIPE